MSRLLLGVDIGTASIKGVLARPNGDNGEVVATAEKVWWNGLVFVSRDLLEGRADVVS